MLALFAVPFLDEVGSGIAPVATPDIARDLALDPGATAGAIIVAFHGIALFVEAPLLAWSERFTVRRVSSVALAALAASLVLAAVAPAAWVLFLALALYGPASGVALAVAEGTLVESRPAERERTMARLTLAGAAGDLAVPLALGALAFFGLGWREGLAAGAALAMGIAVVHARSRALEVPSRFDDEDDEDDDDGEDGEATEGGTLLAALRTALATRPLLEWSFLASLTGLLDEVLVAFTMVRLAVDLDAGPVARAVAVGAWTVGGLVGVAALERWLAHAEPLRLLRLTSVASAICLLVLSLTPHVDVAIVALAALGASGAALHPLLKARAYAALPGRPAIVNAVASALAPLDVAAPIVLAALASWGGPRAALCAILVAPLMIAAGALGQRAREPS